MQWEIYSREITGAKYSAKHKTSSPLLVPMQRYLNGASGEGEPIRLTTWL